MPEECATRNCTSRSLDACSPTQQHNSASIHTTHQYGSQRYPPSVAVVLVFSLFLRNLPVQSFIIWSARNITGAVRVLTDYDTVHGLLNLVRQSFQAHHRTTNAFLNSSIPSCSLYIHTDLFQWLQSTQTDHLGAVFCTYEPYHSVPSDKNSANRDLGKWAAINESVTCRIDPSHGARSRPKAKTSPLPLRPPGKPG